MRRAHLTACAAPLCAAALCAAALWLPSPATAALPSVHVDVPAGRSIADDPKTTARMEIAGPGGYRGPIGIELRGSSSRHFAKWSYALETRARDGEGLNAALLGLPAENDWVLNAAHSDRTLARDALAYATARQLGRWAPRTRHVELHLDGRYAGVYVLTEQPKLDPARVAVERSGISGGYLVERSSTPLDGGFAGPVSGLAYGHKDPSRRQLDDDEARWIAGYVGAAEAALARRDGSWRAFVDEAAAVDYVLLQELFKNQDAFHRSVFLAKGTDRPLVLGPVWDLDRSLGDGHAGAAAAAPQGWVTPGRPWAGDLLADAGFRARLVARWSAFRRAGILDGMLRRLDGHRGALRTAQARNARRWPSTRSPTHAAEMRRLRGWLVDRVHWIDAHVGALGESGPPAR